MWCEVKSKKKSLRGISVAKGYFYQHIITSPSSPGDPMGRVKEFVYRYGGAPHLDHTEIDLTGELPIPQEGSVYHRDGKRWKVSHVVTQLSTDGKRPVVRVSLIKML
jgi:hypothetical protein